MQVYLVGGAVRDKLLNRPVTERDWVVVGASAEEMLAKGYTQVGKDFPVFLHPQTQEEYALARTERKTGGGYTGFTCYTSPEVTLEDDLLRRDLTVNAMAEDARGNRVDPYHGFDDLNNRILRHVSAAFSEDPLRIFRVARFAARYAYLGFTIAPETLALMQTMSASDDIKHLSAERVWQETRRAMMEDSPQVYFAVLHKCGALHAWMPELCDIIAQPNTMTCLQRTAEQKQPLYVRWATLCWPLTDLLLSNLQTRLKVPNLEADCANLAAKFIQALPTGYQHAQWLLSLFNSVDAWRRPERLARFLALLSAVYPARAEAFQQQITLALNAANEVNVQAIIADGFKGSDIKLQLDTQRLNKIHLTTTNQSVSDN